MHEGAGAVEALLTFGEGDGDGFAAAVGEGGDGGREIFGRTSLCGQRECGGCCGGCGGGEEESTAVDLVGVSIGPGVSESSGSWVL